ncbi:ABCF2 [Symbiodinium sp. CCMP2592]|nr:ABCF2 [Symbiodinium sp. CCMP2592]
MAKMMASRLSALVLVLAAVLTSSELECLQMLARHDKLLAGLSPGFTKDTQRVCRSANLDFATLEVHLPRKNAYLQRVLEEASRAAGHNLSANVTARLWICLPVRCTGDAALLRLVTHRALARHMGLPSPFPRALQPSELRWKLLDGKLPAGSEEESTDIANKGRCVCSQDVGDRYEAPSRFSVREQDRLMQDLQKPGLRRQRALSQIHLPPPATKRTLLHVWQHAPKGCHHLFASEGGCVPAALSRYLLGAAAAAASPHRGPSLLLAQLGNAAEAAAVMQSCPWALLDDFACDGCVAPPRGFRPAGLLAKVRAAHAAYASGRKFLANPLSWAGGELTCNRDAADAKYEASAEAVQEGVAQRVACLYLAALPNDYPPIRRMAHTFARHCDWASFFAAPRKDEERRSSWRISVGRREFEIVNLAQAFPQAQADKSWMKMQWVNEGIPVPAAPSSDTFRKRLWSGNTIQKSLLMAVYTARHSLDRADLFCLLELDSAFVAENLRAFARANTLLTQDPHYVASLHLGMKLQIGIFPNTAGGVCMTREALRRLSQHLELLEKDALAYPHPKRVGFWVPTVLDPQLAPRVNGCGFVAGHWWDIMLGRCFVASNVTAHPAVEDELGRNYFTSETLPCQEHLAKRSLPPLPGPSLAPDSLENAARALCELYGFAPEIHRWVPCQPSEVTPVADYWLSPFAIGYHGYKNLTDLMHAYRILYMSAGCDWALPFRPKVLQNRRAANEQNGGKLCDAKAYFYNLARVEAPLGVQAHATDPLEDFFVPTASSRGAVAAADPFEPRASTLAEDPPKTTVTGQPADNFSFEAPCGDESERAERTIAVTPPPGRPPEDRGPRVRRTVPGEDSSRHTPVEDQSNEVQPFSNEEPQVLLSAEASPQPLRSCLKGSASPSGLRAEASERKEATPPNSRGSTKEVQPKRSCLKQSPSPTASPAPGPAPHEAKETTPPWLESSSQQPAQVPAEPSQTPHYPLQEDPERPGRSEAEQAETAATEPATGLATTEAAADELPTTYVEDDNQIAPFEEEPLESEEEVQPNEFTSKPVEATDFQSRSLKHNIACHAAELLIVMGPAVSRHSIAGKGSQFVPLLDSKQLVAVNLVAVNFRNRSCVKFLDGTVMARLQEDPERQNGQEWLISECGGTVVLVPAAADELPTTYVEDDNQIAPFEEEPLESEEEVQPNEFTSKPVESPSPTASPAPGPAPHEAKETTPSWLESSSQQPAQVPAEPSQTPHYPLQEDPERPGRSEAEQAETAATEPATGLATTEARREAEAPRQPAEEDDAQTKDDLGRNLEPVPLKHDDGQSVERATVAAAEELPATSMEDDSRVAPFNENRLESQCQEAGSVQDDVPVSLESLVHPENITDSCFQLVIQDGEEALIERHTVVALQLSPGVNPLANKRSVQQHHFFPKLGPTAHGVLIAGSGAGCAASLGTAARCGKAAAGTATTGASWTCRRGRRRGKTLQEAHGFGRSLPTAAFGLLSLCRALRLSRAPVPRLRWRAVRLAKKESTQSSGKSGAAGRSYAGAKETPRVRRRRQRRQRPKVLRKPELDPNEVPEVQPAIIVDEAHSHFESPRVNTATRREVSWTPAVKGAGEKGRYSTKPVLESVSWSVCRKQKIGLIGPNGCGLLGCIACKGRYQPDVVRAGLPVGDPNLFVSTVPRKSSQLLMLLGQIEPTGGRIMKHPAKMKIAYMQQEADLDNGKTTFEELLSVFGDRSLAEVDSAIKEATADARLEQLDQLVEERNLTEKHLGEVEDLILQLDLVSYRNTLARDMSGGWQMRVALGKIILSRPDLILLDEPTNHIDLETVEFMEELLRAQDVAMVIVSHDRYFLNQVCNRIVEIADGESKTYFGNYVEYLQARDGAFYSEWQEYNLHRDRVLALKKRIKKLQQRFLMDTLKQKKQDLEKLLANAPPKPEVKVVKNFRFPCSLSVASTEEASTEESSAEEEPSEDVDDLWGSEVEPLPLLEVENLNVSFPDKEVLKNISFTLRQGEKVAVVGPNGCGKSTLVKALVNDLDKSGRVEGQASVTSAGSAYFPQRLAEAFNTEEGSVQDALYMSCTSMDVERAGGIEAVLDRLRLSGITAKQPVSSLSGGEKARLAFAKFLLKPVALLVLDEPTNHLDIPTRELLEDALKSFEGAALVVSHDRFFLREFSTRVLEVSNGNIIDHPSWDDYQACAWHEVCRLPFAILPSS